MMLSRRLISAFSAVAVGVLSLLAVPNAAASPGVAATTQAGVAAHVIVVTDAPYGAIGDGQTNDRVAIQQAIDTVAAKGGGTVILPADHTFLSGSLVLKSKVTLRIDGTLLQSQRDADYPSPPTRGHNYPSGIKYALGDHAALHNLPMVYAAHANNVAVVGKGTIQLTRVETGTVKEREDATIHTAAIGLYRVDDFEIRDVSMLGASSYSLALYTVRRGLVAGTRIIATTQDGNTAGGHNTDGISIQNSQYVRITGNTVRAGDDGIYVWASYRDERGGWWSSDDPRPSRFIEIDHNDVVVDRRNNQLCCSAVALIAWGGGGTPTGGNAPDQRQVQISDITVHDNHLEAGYPFRCWCASVDGQSPITRVSLTENEYVWGFAPGANLRGQITDFTTDAPEWYQYMRATTVKNGHFESTAEAWWTATGRAGATRLSEPAFKSKEFRDRLAEANGWVGYLLPVPNQPARMGQAIAPMTPEDYPPVLQLTRVHHEVSAKVVTSGVPVRVVVRNRCDNQTIAEQVVDSRRWTEVHLAFDVAAGQLRCGGVWVGVESIPGQPGWALFDDVNLRTTVDENLIDSADPRVKKVGSWGTYAAATDVGGTHLVGFSAGANLSLSFTGTRARLLGTTDVNLGKADIYIDGALHGTADFYSTRRLDGVVVYDTGTLPAGTHTFELRTTGTKNPKSTNIYTVFDALLYSS